MFTGIVQSIGFVRELSQKDENRVYTLSCKNPFAEHVVLGASIAVNGVCQSVIGCTRMQGETLLTFEAIPETLNKTDLGTLKLGVGVHVERALKFGDELGGHMLSGHVMARSTLLERSVSEAGHTLRLSIPPECRHYIFHKGFIAVDGVSLTVGRITKEYFEVHLIPHTLEHTLFQEKNEGAFLNIECDMQTQLVVETVLRIMTEKGVLSYVDIPVH